MTNPDPSRQRQLERLAMSHPRCSEAEITAALDLALDLLQRIPDPESRLVTAAYVARQRLAQTRQVAPLGVV
jgi:hypothetical protein